MKAQQGGYLFGQTRLGVGFQAWHEEPSQAQAMKNELVRVVLRQLSGFQQKHKLNLRETRPPERRASYRPRAPRDQSGHGRGEGLPRGWQRKAPLPAQAPPSEPSQPVLLGLPGFHVGVQAPPTLKDVDLGAEGHQGP